ncbi:MAG TPA: NIPSNAP family protein [Dehalococcoidia bacterium]|nr:NIPSNAP family protein [Dehalococcoidia bacterium]
MIYEMRVYTAKPGAVGEYESRFGEAYKAREKYSKLGAMWHTEIGPLNQVIHMWQYESLQQRAEIRATAAKDPSGLWPPKTPDLLMSQEVEILDPVKGMKDWGEPQQWGNLYEMRQYTYAPGDIGKAAAAFGEALAARDAIYPVAGMFVAQQGNLNRLYQIFPYKSHAHREEVRAEFRKQGVWPPHAEVRPINQLVRFMEPASFSPIH